jgi:hypothetical protein
MSFKKTNSQALSIYIEKNHSKMKLLNAFSLFLLGLILLCLTLPVYSNPQKNKVVLIVKPKLCVLSNERQTCKDKIIISWKSKKPQSLCLYSNQTTDTLACWRESWSGETEQLIKTKESLLFTLKDKNVIIVEKELEVFKSFAKRNKRSRKRHPWSLF